MDDSKMNRKQFLTNVGKLCACSCVAAMAGGVQKVLAQETNQTPPPEPAQPAKKPRAEQRMEFAEGWLKRFFTALDANVDESTRTKLMMANGKSCYEAWIKDTGQQVRPVTFEQYKSWVDNNVKDGSYRVEGNAIFMQYMYAAETGLPAPEFTCLCPMVENKPQGLSTTYCTCSIGYVRVMYETLFGRPVEVELLESVLRGNPRCKFKITVS
jgi:hypothetical protein